MMKGLIHICYRQLGLPVAFFLLVGCQTVSLSQSRFPITDPRNPDCPCHEAQKIADQEFALLSGGKQNATKLSPKGKSFRRPAAKIRRKSAKARKSRRRVGRLDRCVRW